MASHFIITDQITAFSSSFQTSANNKELILGDNHSMTKTGRVKSTCDAPLVEVSVQFGNHVGFLVESDIPTKNEVVSTGVNSGGGVNKIVFLKRTSIRTYILIRVRYFKFKSYPVYGYSRMVAHFSVANGSSSA